MSSDPKQKTEPSRPMVYQIRIKGHLDYQWADCFGGLAISLEDNGDTLLTGRVIDQAALYGLLKKIRNLGMPLVAVRQIDLGKADVSEPSPENNQHG